MPKTSPAGVDLVAAHEGCELKSYKDASTPPIWTVGYGHTGPSVGPLTRITQLQAEQFLAEDLATFEQIVTNAVTVPLTQGQFDSLVSFCYNTGPGLPDHKDGFVWLKGRDVNGQPQHSTLLRKLNAGDYVGCANEFPKWVHAGAGALSGLVERRTEERALFLTGIAT
jgi:lysozyme